MTLHKQAQAIFRAAVKAADPVEAVLRYFRIQGGLLHVAGRRYRMGEGDSFHFRSERAHSYRNVGKKKARILWLNTPPTF